MEPDTNRGDLQAFCFSFASLVASQSDTRADAFAEMTMHASFVSKPTPSSTACTQAWHEFRNPRLVGKHHV